MKSKCFNAKNSFKYLQAVEKVIFFSNPSMG